MKKILSPLLILLLLAACGGSLPTGARGPMSPDGGLEEGGDTPFDPFGGTGGEGDDQGGGGAAAGDNPCTADPSSEACLCNNPRSRQCICLRSPNDDRCLEQEKPLTIKGLRDEAMKCTLEKECELKLRAAGGSGSYAWSHASAPEHLHLVLEPKEDNERATVTAIPSLAGSYPFTVTLTDTASGESTTAEIAVTASADPVITVYAGESSGEYEAVADTESQIDLPVYRDLKIEVMTHGAKLKYLRLKDSPCTPIISVGGSEVELVRSSDADCSSIAILTWGRSLVGRGDSATSIISGQINKPTNLGESYTSVAYLRAYPGVTGTFVVEAEDESGKVGTALINVGFADDPCLRLAVTAPPVTLKLGAEIEAKEKIKLAVSGGIGPFAITLVNIQNDENQYVGKRLRLNNSCDNIQSGNTCSATALASIRKGVRLKDLFDEEEKELKPQTYRVSVVDNGCDGRKASSEISIAHSVEQEIVMDEDEFTSSIQIGTNDTHPQSRLEASFKDRDGNKIARWSRSMNLDNIGGDDTDDPDVYRKNIEAVGDGGVTSGGSRNGLKRPINMTRFSKVFFRMRDPESGDKMDTRIYSFRIKAGDWCARAVIDEPEGYFENTCEDERDGSDAANCRVTFQFRWKTCDGRENKWRDIKKENRDGCERGAAVGAATGLGPYGAAIGCGIGAAIDAIF